MEKVPGPVGRQILFSVGGAYCVGVAVADPVKQKIDASSKYNSSHRTHLVAWSSSVTAEELARVGQDEELMEHLKCNGLGQFDRIWVFGRSEKCIAFDSSDWSFGNG